ncbi:hypothetical protein FRC12_022029 [Ceratobasidium sp. 428]|nr:hypothetical protein FRC12_022029 [Ceratobasidium sp. 428]
MGCRSEDNAKEAIEHIRNDVTVSEGELRWLPLDLSTVIKARESAKRFLGMEDKLDVLVNNAVVQVQLGQGEFSLNDDGIETMMAVNHIGHFVFTTALLDLMKHTSSREGSDVRIVVVSSIVRALPAWTNPKLSFSNLSELSKPFPVNNTNTWFNQVVRYGRSKLANHLFASELQSRLEAEGSNIIVVCLHPGNVTTSAAVNSVGKMPVWSLISSSILRLAFVNEVEGARNSVFAATSPVIRAEPDKYKGKYLMPIGKVTTPSKMALDVKLAKQLWTLSEVIVESKG